MCSQVTALCDQGDDDVDVTSEDLSGVDDNDINASVDTSFLSLCGGVNNIASEQDSVSYCIVDFSSASFKCAFS